MNYAGLIEIDGDYYYIGSNYKATVNATKTISAARTNGLLPAGTYEFGPDGKMVLDGANANAAGPLALVR